MRRARVSKLVDRRQPGAALVPRRPLPALGAGAESDRAGRVRPLFNYCLLVVGGGVGGAVSGRPRRCLFLASTRPPERG